MAAILIELTIVSGKATAVFSDGELITFNFGYWWPYPFCVAMPYYRAWILGYTGGDAIHSTTAIWVPMESPRAEVIDTLENLACARAGAMGMGCE